MNNNDINQASNQRKPVFFREVPDELRAWASTLFGDTIISVMEFVMTVGLELTRHLAIVNGAGLAGVTALYSAMDGAYRPALLSCAGWFLAGLALAILTLLIMYALGSFGARRLTKVVTEWVANARPFNPASLRLIKFIAVPTLIIGLVSFGCFLVGALKLILALKIKL